MLKRTFTLGALTVSTLTTPSTAVSLRSGQRHGSLNDAIGKKNCPTPAVASAIRRDRLLDFYLSPEVREWWQEILREWEQEIPEEEWGQWARSMNAKHFGGTALEWPSTSERWQKLREEARTSSEKVPVSEACELAKQIMNGAEPGQEEKYALFVDDILDRVATWSPVSSDEPGSSEEALVAYFLLTGDIRLLRVSRTHKIYMDEPDAWVLSHMNTNGPEETTRFLDEMEKADKELAVGLAEFYERYSSKSEECPGSNPLKPYLSGSEEDFMGDAFQNHYEQDIADSLKTVGIALDPFEGKVIDLTF